jgi:hypothetical protein
MRRIRNTVEMPDRMAENLVRFIRLNRGKRGRERPVPDRDVQPILWYGSIPSSNGFVVAFLPVLP